MYAAGKIPGSFFKREGRAGEKATLIARMIDRPLRPLFPKGWRYETQLVAIPLSIDHDHPYDILAMNGASAALMVSNIPFPTPVGAVRIGKVDGNFVVNPTEEQQLTADLDLVVAGTDEAILMVEAGANEITEAEMLDALDIAHGEIKKLCAAQRELAGKVSKPKLEITAPGGRRGPRTARSRSRTARRSTRRRPSRTSSRARTPRRRSRRRCSRSTRATRPPTPTPSTAPRAQLAFDKLEKNIIRQRIAVAQAPPGRPLGGGDPADRHRGRRCCRARTARRSSRAARRRPSPSSPSAPRARRCAWTTSGSRPPSATSTTTTSRPSRSARRASCAAPSGATSATARSPSARSCR